MNEIPFANILIPSALVTDDRMGSVDNETLAKKHKELEKFETQYGLNLDFTKNLLEHNELASFYGFRGIAGEYCKAKNELNVVNTAPLGLAPNSKIICVPPLCQRSDIFSITAGTHTFHPYETYEVVKFTLDLRKLLSCCDTAIMLLLRSEGPGDKDAAAKTNEAIYELFESLMGDNDVWKIIYSCAKQQSKHRRAPLAQQQPFHIWRQLIQLVSQHWQVDFYLGFNEVLQTLLNIDATHKGTLLGIGEAEDAELMEVQDNGEIKVSGISAGTLESVFEKKMGLPQKISSLLAHLNMYLANLPPCADVLLIEGTTSYSRAQPGAKMLVKML